MRETGIFTGTTSSLCLSLRQLQIVTPFVQVGTYPTRNFATLGPFICVNDLNLEEFSRDPRREIFVCPSCRHEDRTISSSRERDAWRVVSEDSFDGRFQI